MFAISDNHGGLTHGISSHFRGASWQRYWVHLLRSMLSQSPVKLTSEVAAHAKLVLHAQGMVEERRQLAEFIERFGKSAPNAVSCLEEGLADAIAVMALPDTSRRRLRATNMKARFNEEIRRRESVIRIFPNDEAALRLIGALLAEPDEAWQGRICLDMDEFTERAAAEKMQNDIANNVVAMSSSTSRNQSS